jgi:hypothetical protein
MTSLLIFAFSVAALLDCAAEYLRSLSPPRKKDFSGRN